MFNSIMQQIDEAVVQRNTNKSFPDFDCPIFIYGTGSFAQDVFHAATEKGIIVSAFLDHMDSDPLPCGLPVLEPEAAHNSVVFIGVHNRAADLSAINGRLRFYKPKRIISSVELFDLLGDSLGARYWLTDRSFYASCAPAIMEAYSLLEDDLSRNLYFSILKFRLTGDCSVLPAPDTAHQYFPSDIPSWESPLRLVDCGAFDGDTIAEFINNDIAIQSIVAFEPDSRNFSKLIQFTSLNQRISDIVLFPCAVSISTSQSSFENNRGEGCILSSKGDSFVQCVALDDAIPTFAANLIKMDIEGSEYDALQGARRLIGKFLPGLAISIYHRPEHLWQIPILLKDIAPGQYGFYIRSHAMSTFDTVLYCIPK